MWITWEALHDAEGIPPWGTAGRPEKLRDFARAEPILSGALGSMVSKAVSLDWQIAGGRNRTMRYQEILAEAEDGAGWSFFLDRLLQDYLTVDLGGFVELGRESAQGPVVALWNLDGGTITATGRPAAPWRYWPRLAGGSLSGTSVLLSPLAASWIVDLPSNDESKHGLGFCAVSRALKAARVLLALYNYEDERLSDMPLPGLVSVTGMTQAEIKAAFDLYQQRRDSRQQTTFKDVLWLAAQTSPINPIDVKLTPFSGLPEGFDRQEVLTQYVYTLALDFGVDVREFWPASQTGATKAEAEVQAQKAKGKGFGRMLAQVERAINWDVLPEGLEFLFDQKDSEDDLLRETIREKVIGNVRRLWEPTMIGEGILTTAEARRWLVELDMAPGWLAETDQVTVYGDSNTGPEEAQPAVDQIMAEKAARAGLAPGEDFVSVNRRGETTILWSSRRVFSAPAGGWPLLASAKGRGEVGLTGPFRTLTAEYP